VISSVRKNISKWITKELIIMSKVPSNYPQKPGKTPTTSSDRLNKVSRLGWPEIVVGLVVLAIVGFGVGSQLRRLGLDPVVYGLVFTSLSGIAGVAGFAAAALLRIRSLNAFGVRPRERNLDKVFKSDQSRPDRPWRRRRSPWIASGILVAVVAIIGIGTAAFQFGLPWWI
jgi:hypothetical protein